MKSYLSLIPISAKAHRKQNRMTLTCIVLAVFLVTAVFGVTEMGVRMETARLIAKHGSVSFLQNDAVRAYYPIAGFLVLLILAAGVLMIAGSINSNVIQRTKFFGMMRCIGMTRSQVIRFVRLEALNWCKTAIPIGLALGTLATWGVCTILHYLVKEEFAEIPVFGLSPVGLISGTIIGLVTVLIAAGAPARRAAKASPVMAASGNAYSIGSSRVGRTGRIELALGVNHATSNRKNFALTVSSFALSIILFLGFAAIIDLVDLVMPQPTNAAQMEIADEDGANSIDRKLVSDLENIAGVKKAFGRSSYLNTEVFANGVKKDGDLIGYSDFDIKCLVTDKQLKHGSDVSKVYEDKGYAITVYDPENPMSIGDVIKVDGESLEIAGLLKMDPFTNDGTSQGRVSVISSAQTFARITNQQKYSLVLAQVSPDIPDSSIAEIKGLMNSGWALRDDRDRQTHGTYVGFKVLAYGFLAIIAMVAVLNIMNSISMSVSSRIKQYGAMRAVGMSNAQLLKMVRTETVTYAVYGFFAGSLLGGILHKYIYDTFTTAHYPYAVWTMPWMSLAVILSFMIVSVALAIYDPVKRISRMSITETINEL